MANVYIDGKRIVPAPLYAISHDINRTAGGVILSCTYNITLTGSLVANRGYPTFAGAMSDSTDQDLDIFEPSIDTDRKWFESLLNKQAALKELVLLEGTGYSSNKKVEIINTRGDLNQQTNTRIEFNYLAGNIEFEPSTVTTISNYTINFTANDIRLNGRSINPASGVFQDYNLRSANDSMSISRSSDRDETVSVTRSVKAQGYKSFDNEIQTNISAISGWEFAREWVKAQFPADPRSAPTLAISGVPIVALPAEYEYVGAVLAEEMDRLNGDYGVTVTWTYGPITASHVGLYALDEYTLSKSDSIIGNKTSYKISGSIKGTKSNTKNDAYTAATNYFINAINTTVLKGRIAGAFGISDSVILGPLNSVVSHNDFAGTIGYDYEFYKKIAQLPICFYDVELSVSKNIDERVIAEIAIPGRVEGPIIQDIVTRQTKKRSVSANFILSSSGTTFELMNGYKTSGFVFLGALGAIPTGTANSDHWQTSFSHNLDIIAGKYSMNIGYVEK